MNSRPLALVLTATCSSTWLFAQTTPTAELRPERMAALPRGVSSFGAATPGDGWAYVFGGHYGRAHAHSKDNVTGSFMRLNLTDGTTWEALPDGPPLQGTALTAHDGVLYRVGGMTAHNEAHDPAEMFSVDTVASFDPADRQWRSLTPLPEGRSSHDAFVIGDTLYVVGGWRLAGSSGDAKWHTTALAADLTHRPIEWRELPAPPFERRAFSIAAHGNKLYALGGLTPDRDMPRVCHVFDPAKNTWSEGPELPGRGFGVAANTMNGRLYASGMDGKLLQLDEDGGAFKPVYEFTLARFFHRIVPDRGEFVAIGGVAGQHARVIERTHLNDQGSRVLYWERPHVAQPTAGRVLGAFRGTLYMSTIDGDARHSEEGSPILRIGLADMSVGHVAPLPVRLTDYSPAQTRRRAFVAGGVAPDGQVSNRIYEYALRSDDWYELDTTLAEGRADAHLLHVDDSIWVVGGRGQDGNCVMDVALLEPTEDDVRLKAAAATRLPRARLDFAAASLGRQLFLVGGRSPDGKPITTVDVWDTSAKAWSTVESPHHAPAGADLVAIAGQLYLACGSTYQDGQGWVPARSLQTFAPDRGWRVVAESLDFATSATRMGAVEGSLVFVTSSMGDRPSLAVHALKPETSSPMLGASPAPGGGRSHF
ncbi:MAG: kelch repeat-containing protein [Planctomycetota bacterium]